MAEQLDLFTPEISHVIEGMAGKIIIIYGPNRAGKTWNVSKAKKPLFLSFEKGLNAIEGVPFFYIDKWTKFKALVDQLTASNKVEEAKKHYSTIIIDTIQGITELADEYICNIFNIGSIGDGNNGYGNWKEYEKEMGKPIRKLCSAGYTIVFLAHEMERKQKNERGEEFVQLYPKSGDAKRCSAIICDLADIIAYAQTQNSADGNEVLSTLHLKGTPAFYAGSRFRKMIPFIPEWSWEKLVAAINEAIAKEEAETGVKAITFAESKKAEAKQKILTEQAINNSVAGLIAEMTEMLKAMQASEGNIETYMSMLRDINAANFKATSVTEASSEEDKNRLQYLYDTLVEKGYYEKAGLGQGEKQ